VVGENKFFCAFSQFIIIQHFSPEAKNFYSENKGLLQTNFACSMTENGAKCGSLLATQSHFDGTQPLNEKTPPDTVSGGGVDREAELFRSKAKFDCDFRWKRHYVSNL